MAPSSSPAGTAVFPCHVPVHPIERLYVEHHGWLLAWLKRTSQDAAAAADIAHDTFVRLLTNRSLASVTEPKALLARIAKGLLIDQWRRHELERAYLEALACRGEVYALSPEDRLAVLQTLERIDRLLDGLRPRVRTAFLRAQLDGWAYARIAQELGVGVRSIERYMAEALYHCHSAMHEA